MSCSGKNSYSVADKTTGCTGKCTSKACAKIPVMWVIAACEGRIALFEKNNGTMNLICQDKAAVAPSVIEFCHWLKVAYSTERFTQLLLVGSAQDISWLHHCLSKEMAYLICAEIRFPLFASLFDKPAIELKSVLERVLAD